MDHSTLHLQGYRAVEDLAEHAVVDGVCGRVQVDHRIVRPRPDTKDLITLVTDDGQRLTYDAGFPVAFYGPEPVYLGRFGRNPITDPEVATA